MTVRCHAVVEVVTTGFYSNTVRVVEVEKWMAGLGFMKTKADLLSSWRTGIEKAAPRVSLFLVHLFHNVQAMALLPVCNHIPV